MAFQVNITNEGTWKAEIEDTPGTIQVVEVYNDWCGPARAIISTFKRIYFDFSDKPLKFYTASADKLDIFDKYRGKCKPVFMFYKDNACTATIEGVNAPELERKILEMLEEFE